MLLRIQRFAFTLVYKKGKLMFKSDTLSRSCPKSDTSNIPFLEENNDAQVCPVWTYSKLFCPGDWQHQSMSCIKSPLKYSFQYRNNNVTR